jgi:hypothetical protein
MDIFKLKSLTKESSQSSRNTINSNRNTKSSRIIRNSRAGSISSDRQECLGIQQDLARTP